MSAKINAVRSVLHARKSVPRNALILDVHRNVERFATNAQRDVRSNANIANVTSSVMKFVTENHVNCLVIWFWTVVILVLDFAEKLVPKYAEIKSVRIMMNQHLRFCLEWKMILKPGL